MRESFEKIVQQLLFLRNHLNIPVWSLLSVSCGLAPLFRSISTVTESPSNEAYISAVLKNKPSQEQSTMYTMYSVYPYFNRYLKK